jgi:7-cyano-7-deazaguanine synthase
MEKKAIVLLSGGLDSATCLALAKRRGFEIYALSFDYGQRHRCELDAAKRVAMALGAVEHRIFRMDLSQWGGSALTDTSLDVPVDEAAEGSDTIPITYVPARNLVFLSLAAAWGEVLGAHDIFIGVNNVDYSGYPDCRPAFINAFMAAVNAGTRAADEKWHWHVHTPLQALCKKEIIELGISAGVDYSLTVSCYNPDVTGAACGHCASCQLRRAGFAAAGISDPTRYQRGI